MKFERKAAVVTGKNICIDGGMIKKMMILILSLLIFGITGC